MKKTPLTAGQRAGDLCACALAAAVLNIPLAQAQDEALALAPTAKPIEVVRVNAGRAAATLPSIEAARAEASSVAGGASVVDAEQYREGRVSNLADALGFAPGVWAASRFGAEEARVSIRGSGLQRTFHLRGIEILQDGAPLNLADGSVDFQAIEPLASRYVQVWRGANALQFGAATLGGALNFSSPTGRDVPALGGRVEGGSFGYLRGQLNAGFASEAFDGLLSVNSFQQQGYREHAEQNTQRLFANLGWQINAQAASRVLLSLIHSRSALPGALTAKEMAAAPEQADPATVRGDQRRDFELYRIANLSSFALGSQAHLEAGAFFAYKHLSHPIYQVLEQRSHDYGVNLRWVDAHSLNGRANRFVAGANWHQGRLKDDRFVNVQGQPGARTTDAVQDSSSSALFAEWQHAVFERSWLVLGGQYTLASRQLEDDFLSDGADNSVARDYRQFSPKIGLRQEFDGFQLFANGSGSYEPPSFGELAGGPNVSPVEAQKARSLEIGGRSAEGATLGWELSLYRAMLRDELLSLNDAQGRPLGTVNAERSVHQGVEAGAVAHLRPLRLRVNYLFNDFRFDADPVYGKRTLAGVPRQMLKLEAHYEFAAGFYAGPNLDAASGTWVDHANTLRAAGYGALGFKFGQRAGKGYAWFLEGRNLLDRNYASTTGVVADAKGRDSRQFYPADGRAFYAGIELSL